MEAKATSPCPGLYADGCIDCNHPCDRDQKIAFIGLAIMFREIDEIPGWGWRFVINHHYGRDVGPLYIQEKTWVDVNGTTREVMDLPEEWMVDECQRNEEFLKAIAAAMTLGSCDITAHWDRWYQFGGWSSQKPKRGHPRVWYYRTNSGCVPQQAADVTVEGRASDADWPAQKRGEDYYPIIAEVSFEFPGAASLWNWDENSDQ